MDTFNNETIASKYKKDVVLGEGTFGRVYLVKLNNTSYVLKEIDLNSLNSEEKKRAFLEVQLLANLKNKFIIGYKSSTFDHISGKLSIIMDYADCGDLASAITKQMGIPFSDHITLSWFTQIVLALQYIHSQNILHRDLKTQNIFLSGNNLIKVGDFGVSRLLKNSKDFASTRIGTPYYLSPEIYIGKQYNHKSDMWALGCVLFEISTLELPFKAETLPQLMVVILEGKRQPFPSWMKSDLMKQLVEDLLFFNPDQRPSTEDVLAYTSLKPYVSFYAQSTKDISIGSINRKTYYGSPKDDLKRSASVLSSNKSNLHKCARRTAEYDRKQPTSSTQAVPPAIVVTQYQDKFEANEQKPHSWSTRTVPPAIVVTQYQDKFEANEQKPRSASTRIVPPAIIVPEYKDKFEANEQGPLSAPTRTVSPAIIVPEYKDKFEANEQKPRVIAIGGTPPAIVTESKTTVKFEEKKQKKRFVFSKVTSPANVINKKKTADKYSTSKADISSRSDMNTTYIVEKKANSLENSKSCKLCSLSSPYDIDCGYSSEEISCSADSSDNMVFEHSINDDGKKLSIQKSMKHEDEKTSHSIITSNQSHCDHSQCPQCLIDMMWKNRIRGCAGVSRSNGDYLKLKKKLLLIFGRDMFQKVYESLLHEWEANESSNAQTSIRSFAKLLNYEQVQHLPLMMQLIQLDLVKLSKAEAYSNELVML